MAYVTYIFDPNVRRSVTTLRVRVTCTCTRLADPNDTFHLVRVNVHARCCSVQEPTCT
jgi:hypothetical protein